MESDSAVKCSSLYSKLPSMMSAVRQSELQDAKSLLQRSNQKSEEMQMTFNGEASEMNSQMSIKQEPIDTDEPMDSQESKHDNSEIPNQYFKAKTAAQILARFESKVPSELNCDVKELASSHGDFIKDLSKYTTRPCLSAISQLCHRSTMLAHKIWVDLYPRIWDLLEDKYQTVLAGEIGPFLCSGSHLHQGDCYRSSINTFVEGMANCSPAIPIRPAVLKYLGKTHNLWHRSALLLEEATVACEDMLSVNPQLPIQQPWLDFGMLFFHIQC